MNERLLIVKNRLLLHRKELVFAAIIFVVSTLSFGLGYLANREYNHSPIVIQLAPGAASSSALLE